MSRNMSRPRSDLRLRVTPFLLEFSSRKNHASSPRLSESAVRPCSPEGGSILTTSAPSHASICVLLGPASYCVRSSTRIPSRAFCMASSPSAAPGRRVAKRQLVIAHALDLDHQHHALVGIGAHRERGARVLVRDLIHDFEVA